MNLLEVKNLKKTYTTRFGSMKCQALNGVNFNVEKGEFVAIMGESGSGKTTLLNIIAGIDSPSEGEIILNGQNYDHLSEKDITIFRRNHMGFVFQDFSLLDNFNIKDNILLPLVLSGKSVREMENKIYSLVNKLGIESLLLKQPYEVSGGQKQRVAVARALINDPDLILADEPTGALDSKASDELLNLFEDIHDGGQTILMVTHSTKAASYASRVLFIKDGSLFHQIYKGDDSNEMMYKKISDTLSLLLKDAK